MLVTKLELRLIAFDAPAYMVSARAGMSPSRLSEYRHGKKKIAPHHLVSLARVLQCNPEDLIGFAANSDEFVAVND